MSSPQQAPDPATTAPGSTAPTAAGIYDCLLDGTHHSEADRRAAKRVMAAAPEAVAEVRENRAFMQRAVRHLARQGVRQYLDIGSGFPAAGPVHEIAAEIVTDPHVLYVDYDRNVTALGRQMLGSSPHVAAVAHDLRRPWDIIDDPQTARLIDWSQPVAVLMVGVLHFVADDENPADIIGIFRDRMVAGSYLVLSHACGGEAPEAAEKASRAWDDSRSRLTLRDPREVEDLLVGFDLIPPGLVTTTQWGTDRPAPTGRGVGLAAVAVVP
jgi:hypothetical protein